MARAVEAVTARGDSAGQANRVPDLWACPAPGHAGLLLGRCTAIHVGSVLGVTPGAEGPLRRRDGRGDNRATTSDDLVSRSWLNGSQAANTPQGKPTQE